MRKLCRTCLKLCNKNLQRIEDVTIEIMNILLLKVNLDITDNPALCCQCAGILQKCFSFKSACFYTEEFLFPFINFENDPDGQLDLKELYLKTQSLEGVNISPCEKICRLCMELVSDDVLTLLCDMDLDMMRKCLPEVNVMLTKEPVICDTCHDLLKTYMSFFYTCAQTEEKINRYRQIKGVNKSGKVPLTKVPGFSKEGQCDEEIVNNFQNSIVPKDGKIEYKARKRRRLQYHYTKEEIKRRKYTCLQCPYRTNSLTLLRLHSIIHTNRSHLEWYYCNTCTYKTTRKCDITRHIATHHRKPKKIIYKKCPLCNYQARFSSNIRLHMSCHEDPLNLKMYSCRFCSYKARFKGNVKDHMRKHAKTYTYHCEVCSFRTKYIESLKRHSIMHKDASELQFLHCAECNFKTLRKPMLIIHIMKTHMDPSKALMYRCAECTYTTVVKWDFKKHVLIHKRRSFKSKKNITKHVL